MARRTIVAAAAFSAAALIGLAVNENYRDTAYVPIPGDKPTIGFGDTQGVRIGDKTTPVRALVKLQQNINATERAIQRKSCLGDVLLTQGEYDAVIDLAYRAGASAVCSSTLAKIYRTQPVDYAAACHQYKRWTYFQGKDCRIKINRCSGVVDRAEYEYKLCMGEQA